MSTGAIVFGTAVLVAFGVGAYVLSRRIVGPDGRSVDKSAVREVPHGVVVGDTLYQGATLADGRVTQGSVRVSTGPGSAGYGTAPPDALAGYVVGSESRRGLIVQEG